MTAALIVAASRAPRSSGDGIWLAVVAVVAAGFIADGLRRLMRRRAR